MRNALPVLVCPQCNAAQVALAENPAPFPHVDPCIQPPVPGTWVSEGGWPCYIDEEGIVTEAGHPTSPDPGDEGADVPDTDDAEVPDDTVRLRDDGDDAYFDDEQKAAGR